MLYKDICKILTYFVLGITAALAIPLLLAGYYEFIALPTAHPQPHTTLAFLKTILICLATAGVLWGVGRKAKGVLYRREGIAIVVIIWLGIPILAALPFLISNTLKNPYAAYFEAVSGLTTTGSTVMAAKHFDPETGKEVPIVAKVPGAVPSSYTYYGTIEPVRDQSTGQITHEGIEAVGKGLLFWRSFTQWLGGGGIVVLFIAVLPALGVGGKILFTTEMTGPLKGAFTPRIKETAIQMWKIYLGLTVVEIALLKFTNTHLGWFDTVTIAMASLSTGGFSVRNASIGAYNSAATEWTVIVCMLLGSINFSLYYNVLRGKFYRIYEPEFFLYAVVIFIGCFLTSWYLFGGEMQLLVGSGSVGHFDTHDAIRYGTFQLISSITSSGFTTANYDIWPYACQMLMLVVMFMGGMSGSTAGGIKMMRHYMLFRIGQNKVESLFQPETVRTFRVGSREVDSSSTLFVLCFFLIITAVSVLGIMLYIIDGCDLETATGLVACMVNCTGLSFRVAGPFGSCAFMSDFGLILSSLLMVLGRLEFFAILAMLVPAFWKQNS